MIVIIELSCVVGNIQITLFQYDKQLQILFLAIFYHKATPYKVDKLGYKSQTIKILGILLCIMSKLFLQAGHRIKLVCLVSG